MTKRQILSPTSQTQTYGALVAAVVMGAAAVIALLVPSGDDLGAGVVFKAGTEEMTATELNDYVDTLEGLYGIQPPKAGDEADDFRRDTAKSMAVSFVLDEAAEEAGIEITSRQIEDQLNALIDNAYGGDKSAFVQMLGQKGISEDDVREEISNQLQNVHLYQRVTKDIPETTKSDAKAYYEENKDEMVSPEQRRLSNIVVMSRKEAEALTKQLHNGANFESLAKQSSLDSKTSTRGGDLGLMAAQDLEGGYAKAAFAADEGALYGPVKTENGWNVGRVVKIVAETPLEFEQLEKTIRNKMSDDASLAAWREWLTDQLGSADIVYADDYKPADPDSAPANPAVAPGAGKGR